MEEEEEVSEEVEVEEEDSEEEEVVEEAFGEEDIKNGAMSISSFLSCHLQKQRTLKNSCKGL